MGEPLLSANEIEPFLDAALAELQGDWVLLGGALVALWLDRTRVTADIDLVGMQGTMAERLALLELAESHGLSVEAVNSAADFFLRRIPGWASELELLEAGSSARVFRPTPTLFILLKAGRLTEQDLEDCRALLALVEREDLPLDRQRLLAVLDGLPATGDESLAERRAALRTILQE